MSIEEILAGESKNVEFKENLPEKSIKYMKSVVAFANGIGGKIIFGIADKTREVVGFDKEDVFKKMDAIANAVSDSCEPAIIPDITLQTIEGKTVIVVEVSKGRQQLRSWGILIERDGKDYPSNAFAILTGNGGLHVATQCGVFKGTTKAVFVDHREYTGPLWEQIDEVFQFVLRNIHLGATIVGIYRQDVYEIPPDAIRELIINAMVHRSYLDHGTIQVAVYDNRLEITSPGKLPMGQTMERMKEGYSKIRNEAIAHAFAYMNLIEHWGSGIPRIIEKVTAVGLQEPEFIGGEVDLRINIYRGQVDTNNATINANDTKNGVNGVNNGTNGTEVPFDKEQTQIEKLLQIIEKNPSATQAYYAEEMGISKRTISRMFASLQEKGRLVQNETKSKLENYRVRGACNLKFPGILRNHNNRVGKRNYKGGE